MLKALSRHKVLGKYKSSSQSSREPTKPHLPQLPIVSSKSRSSRRWLEAEKDLILPHRGIMHVFPGSSERPLLTLSKRVTYCTLRPSHLEIVGSGVRTTVGLPPGDISGILGSEFGAITVTDVSGHLMCILRVNRLYI